MKAKLIAYAQSHGFKAYDYSENWIAVEIPFYNSTTGEEGTEQHIVGNWSELRAILGY